MSLRQAGFLTVALAVPALSLTAPARAQDPDSAAVLSGVRVTVSRDAARPTFDLPYALSRLSLDSTRGATRRASLTEALLFVPGVSVSNRYNPTQDPRLAIRGFGARSAFGIRGVRVLRDGIPLTAADGQTAVDFLDLESLGAAELFRGSASALYGNSSGGVIDFRTTPPPDAGGQAAFTGWMSGEISRLSLSGGRRFGDGGLGLQGILTRNSGEGPRDYSQFESTNVMGDARWEAFGATRFQFTTSVYDAPEAQNPGALTAAEMEIDPTLPDSNNIVKKAGKVVSQALFSLQAAREFGDVAVTASGQLGARDLENPQSFAIIDLERVTNGASVRAQYAGGADARLRLAIGADLLNQIDDRQNYTNCAGTNPRPPATCPGTDDRGSQTVDQEERVSGLGAYVRGEYLVSSKLSLTGAVRSDRTRYDVTDRRATDPALAEPSRTMSAVSPMFGVNYRVSALSSAYASVSTSFETPTTTELANRPTGVGGLNPDLEPQRGISYELGYKAVRDGLRYDAAIYMIVTEDELIPFQVPGAAAGRQFFRNAGQTTRQGAEVGLSGKAGPVSLGATAMWLKYVYDEFTVAGTDFADNRVPGVAPFTMNAFASMSPTWGLVAVELMHSNRVPVNNANTAYAESYQVVNARVAFRPSTSFLLEPVIGVENIFDKTWASNVVVNAAGGRFFEPGAPRTFYAGLRMGTR